MKYKNKRFYKLRKFIVDVLLGYQDTIYYHNEIYCFKDVESSNRFMKKNKFSGKISREGEDSTKEYYEFYRYKKTLKNCLIKLFKTSYLDKKHKQENKIIKEKVKKYKQKLLTNRKY